MNAEYPGSGNSATVKFYVDCHGELFASFLAEVAECAREAAERIGCDWAVRSDDDPAGTWKQSLQTILKRFKNE